MVLFSFAACLGLAWRGLPFSSDRSRLLPPGDPRQQRYERLRKAFPAIGREIAIVLEGRDEEARLLAARALEEELGRDDWFERPLGSLRLPRLAETALFYMPESERQELLAHLRQGRVDDSDQLALCLQERGLFRYRSPYGKPPPPAREEVALQVGEANLVLVQVRESAAERPEAAGERLNAHLREVLRRFPGLRGQPTGDFIARMDDARTARTSALRAALLSVVLVKLLFWTAFGESRRPWKAFAGVLAGMAWASAFAALTVGRLNLITVNFLATLVGLGMDFALQLIYRFEEERDWSVTLRGTGRENLVGALATAAAFFSLCLTGFRGVAELGWIAGFGVLFCFLSVHLVLPLLLRTPAPDPPHWRLAWLSRWEEGWLRHRGLVLAAAVLFSLWAAIGCRRVTFDQNLLHMQPSTSLAVRAESTFRRQGQRSVLFVSSLCADEATARTRAEQFRALPEVAAVVGLPNVLPSAQVGPILEAAAALQAPPPPHHRNAAELLRLKAHPPDMHNPRLKAVLGRLGPGPIEDGLYTYESAVYADVAPRVAFLRRQSDRPPALEDVPPAYRERFLAPDGQWLLNVYPRPDVWEREPLDAFLAACRQVDPDCTGMPTLTQAYLAILSDCYLEAARNALITIVLLLLVFFRSPSKALWALLPKLLGGLWMFGILGWLGIPLNPANATALPLTLGVGLVFGVHVVHRLFEKPGPIFTGSTGAATFMSGLSTVCGYLSLVVAPHRGIASLGLVMAVGVTANLITALVVLPCLLRRS